MATIICEVSANRLVHVHYTVTNLPLLLLVPPLVVEMVSIKMYLFQSVAGSRAGVQLLWA